MLAQAVAAGAKLRREFLAAVDEYAEKHGMTREEVLDDLAERARTTGRAAAERVITEARRFARNPAFWATLLMPGVGSMIWTAQTVIARRRP